MTELTINDLMKVLPEAVSDRIRLWPRDVAASDEGVGKDINSKAYVEKLYSNGNPLSLEDFSKGSGIRFNSLKKYIQTHRITRRNAYKLCSYLSISPPKFLRDVEVIDT